jgi:hypothetical protein
MGRSMLRPYQETLAGDLSKTKRGEEFPAGNPATKGAAVLRPYKRKTAAALKMLP